MANRQFNPPRFYFPILAILVILTVLVTSSFADRAKRGAKPKGKIAPGQPITACTLRSHGAWIHYDPPVPGLSGPGVSAGFLLQCQTTGSRTECSFITFETLSILIDDVWVIGGQWCNGPKIKSCGWSDWVILGEAMSGKPAALYNYKVEIWSGTDCQHLGALIDWNDVTFQYPGM
jgi:hypothetical protein